MYYFVSFLDVLMLYFSFILMCYLQIQYKIIEKFKDYSFTKKFEHLLKVNDIDCINKEYDEQVTYRLYIDDLSFFDTIQDLTSNRYSKEFIKKEYVPVK